MSNIISHQRDAYFVRMETALKEAAIATPTMVIDIERLNANVDRIVKGLPEGMDFRIVAKSIPSPRLISHVSARAKTFKLMTFSLPMLRDLAVTNPNYQQMLGKPLPVKAASLFYEQFETDSKSAEHVHWLIDTVERLKQYDELAKWNEGVFNITLEIDVGLRRGGFPDGAAVKAAAEFIKQSDNLKLTGLMGYDPHVPKIPSLFGWREKEKHAVQRRYRTALQVITDVLGTDVTVELMRNAAGSPTFRGYRSTNIANEISAGSILVKPSDFDYPELRDFEAAAFVAAPVLKMLDEPMLPGLEPATPFLKMAGLNKHKRLFLYGGKWMADPVDPPGLSYSGVMGRSSNQEAVNAPVDTPIAVDDFVFLRPTQSEAILTYFGALAIFDGKHIIDHWSCYPAHG